MLNYPGDVYGTDNVLIHEFSHAVHGKGLDTIDPTFDNRLKAAYEEAIKNKLWEGTYASTNRAEYWAEGVQFWFDNNSAYDINTRTELKNYDPALAMLINEVYEDRDWRYTPAITRLDLPHLQGFDPQDSPTFEWPPDLAKVGEQLRDPNSDGNGKWVNLKRYEPSQLSDLTSSRSSIATDIIFVNTSNAVFDFIG